MDATAVFGGRRKRLDELVRLLVSPGFASLFRRVPAVRESAGHVSPSILAASSPRSRYVRTWRRHARRCRTCAEAFRYLGLSID